MGLYEKKAYKQYIKIVSISFPFTRISVSASFPGKLKSHKRRRECTYVEIMISNFLILYRYILYYSVSPHIKATMILDGNVDTSRLICCIPIKATMILDGTTSSICQYNIWVSSIQIDLNVQWNGPSNKKYTTWIILHNYH